MTLNHSIVIGIYKSFKTGRAWLLCAWLLKSGADRPFADSACVVVCGF
jgi:hypothetical protein